MKDNLDYLIELRDKYEFMKDSLAGELEAGKYKRCHIGKRMLMGDLLREYQTIYSLIEEKIESMEPA